MTEKQIAAAQANGRRSKGPATERGKRNSSRNSIRHSLLARTVVLDEESEERFQALFQGYIDEYRPGSATQLSLVETMALARWRLLRVVAAQKTALDRDIALQDPSVGPPPVRAVFALGGLPGTSCAPALLLRYETAFDRQFSRALTQLRALKAQPLGSHPEPYESDNPSGHTWKVVYTKPPQQHIDK